MPLSVRMTHILINIAICMNHLSSNYDEYLPPPRLLFCLTNIVIITIFTVLIAIIHEARFSLHGMPSRKEKICNRTPPQIFYGLVAFLIIILVLDL